MDDRSELRRLAEENPTVEQEFACKVSQTEWIDTNILVSRRTIIKLLDENEAMQCCGNCKNYVFVCKRDKESKLAWDKCYQWQGMK